VSVSSKNAIVWGSSGSVDGVLWFEPQEDDPTDSGYSLLRADAPRPGPDADTLWELVCLGCVLEEWPDISRGLDLARVYGEAELDGGEWRARAAV
jgi:hypothetical protein